MPSGTQLQLASCFASWLCSHSRPLETALVAPGPGLTMMSDGVIVLSTIKSKLSMRTSTSAPLAYRVSFLRTVFHLLLLLPLTPQNTASAMILRRKAWQCSGMSQHELVQHLQEAKIIQRSMVAELMKTIDRAHYLSDSRGAYQDSPQSISHGQTMSAPHMHAYALEALLPSSPPPTTASSTFDILDVGTGSGYLTACFAQYLHQHRIHGHVYAVDVFPVLVRQAQLNLQTSNPELSPYTTFLCQNAWEPIELQDEKKNLQFDIIHVGAAAAELPIPLLQQLKLNGILLCPIGPQDSTQQLVTIQRTQLHPKYDPHDYLMTPLMNVRYVPLIKTDK